jgi:hypothetical protein
MLFVVNHESLVCRPAYIKFSCIGTARDKLGDPREDVAAGERRSSSVCHQ